MKKYTIMAQCGCKEDWTWDEIDEVETFDEVDQWYADLDGNIRIFVGNRELTYDEARERYHKHMSICRAFNDLAFDEIVGLDMTECNPDEVRESVHSTLKKYGLTVSGGFEEKVNRRYYNTMHDQMPFWQRHCLVLNQETGKYEPEFRPVEIEELPF